jgi:hypothetical protein
MSVALQQMRLHLEHERLWGVEEIRGDFALNPKTEKIQLLVFGTPADWQEGPCRTLLAKMLEAIGFSLQNTELLTMPKNLQEVQSMRKSSLQGILAFGIAGCKLLGQEGLQGPASRIARTPGVATFGPSHLLCRPADKIGAWNALKSLRALIDQRGNSPQKPFIS